MLGCDAYPVVLAMRAAPTREARQALYRDQYVQSWHWQKLHWRVMGRAHEVCERCRKRPPVDVHHMSFARLGHEDLLDLIALCEPCLGIEKVRPSKQSFLVACITKRRNVYQPVTALAAKAENPPPCRVSPPFSRREKEARRELEVASRRFAKPHRFGDPLPPWPEESPKP